MFTKRKQIFGRKIAKQDECSWILSNQIIALEKFNNFLRLQFKKKKRLIVKSVSVICFVGSNISNRRKFVTFYRNFKYFEKRKQICLFLDSPLRQWSCQCQQCHWLSRPRAKFSHFLTFDFYNLLRLYEYCTRYILFVLSILLWLLWFILFIKLLSLFIICYNYYLFIFDIEKRCSKSTIKNRWSSVIGGKDFSWYFFTLSKKEK